MQPHIRGVRVEAAVDPLGGEALRRRILQDVRPDGRARDIWIYWVDPRGARYQQGGARDSTDGENSVARRKYLVTEME